MPRNQTIAVHIGTHLRAARKKAGLLQKEAAARIGTTPSQISGWESGSYIPTIPKAIALADAYDVTLDQLLGHPADGPQEGD